MSPDRPQVPKPQREAAPPRAALPRAAGAPRVTSESLFGGAAELLIEHRGTQYRLRQTALGKLILTK